MTARLDVAAIRARLTKAQAMPRSQRRMQEGELAAIAELATPALCARVTELEAALREIRFELTPPVDRRGWRPSVANDKAEAIARAALKGGGE